MLQFGGSLLLGYLLGSIPFGLLLTRAAGLGDIRNIGSGNIGATNVLRTGNKALAAATLLLDAAKGAVAVLLAGWFAGRDGVMWAGIGAVLGHAFPVWLGFRGGKTVATSYGVLIAAAWPVGIAAGAVWLVMAALFRISSLAALVSFAAAPIFAFLVADATAVKIALAIAVLVFVRHHTNIRRLLAGSEPRIGHRASTSSAGPG
ncbi:MAG TPA: glycerol-3-phosphate 1-O-acyltransferase PlsY [Acetobacteraceae bacterium]|jgi:glycerol-3-phosphate acyltransferase PlsY|nr:glycerol-3-phosphate 1-O-acyltransferase PlsY [Acetobacteraceae bacterium]